MITDREQLIKMQEAADAVYIADSVYEYIARLADATRRNEMIQLGISPRGTLALCRMAKAYAFVTGKDLRDT